MRIKDRINELDQDKREADIFKGTA